MEALYATVVEKLHKEGQTNVVESLVAHLKRHGRLKLLPRILTKLKAHASRSQLDTPVLEVAREQDTASALKAAQSEGLTVADTIVNPTLIRGWRVRSRSALVDRSGKRGLIDLYQNIVR